MWLFVNTAPPPPSGLCGVPFCLFRWAAGLPLTSRRADLHGGGAPETGLSPLTSGLTLSRRPGLSVPPPAHPCCCCCCCSIPLKTAGRAPSTACEAGERKQEEAASVFHPPPVKRSALGSHEHFLPSLTEDRVGVGGRMMTLWKNKRGNAPRGVTSKGPTCPFVQPPLPSCPPIQLFVRHTREAGTTTTESRRRLVRITGQQVASTQTKHRRVHYSLFRHMGVNDTW